MKFVDEYRNKAQVLAIAGEIGRLVGRNITLMEVCGGHTMALRRFGIPGLMPEQLRLVSGPGCPVCVSDQQFLDQLLVAAKLKDVIIATYGDLIRVPGSDSSLENERKNGADVRMVYSVLDAVQIARENPSKRVIFPGIGFETTAPATAAAVLSANKDRDPQFLCTECPQDHASRDGGPCARRGETRRVYCTGTCKCNYRFVHL